MQQAISKFEATPAQKRLADIGRAMMDYSEQYGVEHGLGRVTDNGLRTLNELSQVGYMLTTVGAAWGSTMQSFTQDQLNLIDAFGKKEVDIEHKWHYN